MLMIALLFALLLHLLYWRQVGKDGLRGKAVYLLCSIAAVMLSVAAMLQEVSMYGLAMLAGTLLCGGATLLLGISEWYLWLFKVGDKIIRHGGKFLSSKNKTPT